MKNWWKAVESAYRAGLKQYRRMRTMQRQAAAMPNPLGEQS